MAKKKTTTKKASSKKSAAQGKTAAKGRTRKPSKGNGKLSGLDAAAQILGQAKEPMGCKGIVEQAIEKGLWSPKGKTPHATLYAAIIREISKKGKEARFKKVDRGRFQLAR
ncbi:MAG: winged helix-turn-helix domain-containing protein [Planctomycetota bacterium]|jgi:hypothetical protein